MKKQIFSLSLLNNKLKKKKLLNNGEKSNLLTEIVSVEVKNNINHVVWKKSNKCKKLFKYEKNHLFYFKLLKLYISII
jgi:hypothetical protein